MNNLRLHRLLNLLGGPWVWKIPAKLSMGLVVISRSLELLLLLLLLVKKVLQVLLLLGWAHLCCPGAHHSAWRLVRQDTSNLAIIYLPNNIGCGSIQLHCCQQVLQGFILFVKKLQMIGFLGWGGSTLSIIDSTRIGYPFHRGTPRYMVLVQCLSTRVLLLLLLLRHHEWVLEFDIAARLWPVTWVTVLGDWALPGGTVTAHEELSGVL
jgi:hypothetical protein